MINEDQSISYFYQSVGQLKAATKTIASALDNFGDYAFIARNKKADALHDELAARLEDLENLVDRIRECAA